MERGLSHAERGLGRRREGGEGSGFTYNGIGDAEMLPVPDIEGHRDSFDILGFDVEPGDAGAFQGMS